MDRRKWAWRRAAEHAAVDGEPVSLETVCAAAAAAIMPTGMG